MQSVATASVLLDGRGPLHPVRAMLARGLPSVTLHGSESRGETMRRVAEEAPHCVVTPFASEATVAPLVRSIEENDLLVTVLALFESIATEEALSLAGHACVVLLRWPASTRETVDAARDAVSRTRRAREIRSERTALESRMGLLSERESEVLDLIVNGLPSKAIAYRLSISKRTVDDHRRSILAKTGAESTVALIADLGRLALCWHAERELTRGAWRRAGELPPCLRGFAPLLASPADETGAPPAAGLDVPEVDRRVAERLEELERSETPACWLDEELRIGWANDAWRRLSEAGEGEDREVDAERSSAAPRSIGRDYTAPMPARLRLRYRSILSRCWESGEDAQHDDDSPWPLLGRGMRLDVRSFPGAGLLLTHHPRGEGLRGPGEPLPRADGQD